MVLVLSFNIINSSSFFLFLPYQNFLIKEARHFSLFLIFLEYFCGCFSYDLSLHHVEDVQSFFYWFNFVFDLYSMIWKVHNLTHDIWRIELLLKLFFNLNTFLSFLLYFSIGIARSLQPTLLFVFVAIVLKYTFYLFSQYSYLLHSILLLWSVEF